MRSDPGACQEQTFGRSTLVAELAGQLGVDPLVKKIDLVHVDELTDPGRERVPAATASSLMGDGAVAPNAFSV